MAIDERTDADEAAVDTKPKKTSRSTRRDLLKLAGATLAGAAGGAALRAAPALAADGDPLTAGNATFETLGFATGNVTTATYTAGLIGIASTGGVGTYGYTNGGFYGVGVEGRSVGGFGTGVKGLSGGFSPGVWGVSSLGTGVYGTGPFSGVYAYTGTTAAQAAYAYTAATNSVGLRAKALGSISLSYGTFPTGVVATGTIGGVAGNGGYFGVYGYSSAGYGVSAFTFTGIDVKLNGTGRLGARANITGGVYGAPTYTPTSALGPNGLFETVRDHYGGMWISRNQGSGQAAWKKVNAIRADSDDGAGTAYKPFRLLDTRSGKYNGVITLADKGPFATNHSLTFTVAGTGAAKSHIPADAAAVFGNLTVTGFTGSGWLTIAPAGAGTIPTSDPSSVNFGPGVAPAIANSFFVGLGTGGNAGKVTVYVEISSGASVNFIVDITGYSH